VLAARPKPGLPATGNDAAGDEQPRPEPDCGRERADADLDSHRTAVGGGLKGRLHVVEGASPGGGLGQEPTALGVCHQLGPQDEASRG
jgi:hypothetical protein